MQHPQQRRHGVGLGGQFGAADLEAVQQAVAVGRGRAALGGELGDDRGIPLHELTPTTGSLEDAYLALTGDSVEYRTKEIS